MEWSVISDGLSLWPAAFKSKVILLNIKKFLLKGNYSNEQIGSMTKLR